MAPREVLAAAVAIYKESCPVSIVAEAAGGVEIARRVASGEAVDVVVLSSDAIDKLIEGGQLCPASRVRPNELGDRRGGTGRRPPSKPCR